MLHPLATDSMPGFTRHRAQSPLELSPASVLEKDAQVRRTAYACRLTENQWSRIRSRSVTRAAEAGTFPCQLCTHTPQSVKACQDLVTTGSRLFGLGGLFKVRIYDFAVYIHPEQVITHPACLQCIVVETKAPDNKSRVYP